MPHRFAIRRIDDLEGAVAAITSMVVRGAPLIGATAAYGLALALRRSGADEALERARRVLLASRPTAVNLRHALDDVGAVVAPLAPEKRAEAAWARAGAYCDEDVALNRRIGEAGLPLIEAVHREHGRTVNILTHCNAGWLATVDWGTATAPIYMAHDRGVPVHVYVDETRPRNQGAALTAFELGQHGVPHTVVADNAGGHLMQRGLVDLAIVGADRDHRARRRRQQDRHLPQGARGARPRRALLRRRAAHLDRLDDPRRPRRDRDRGARPPEVTHIVGRLEDGAIARVALDAARRRGANPAFDVTPAELIDGFITDRGIFAARRPRLHGPSPRAYSA